MTATAVVAAVVAAAGVATGAESDREGDLGPPKIALAHAGHVADPGAWSGVPAGLARGLEAAGADVVRLGLDSPGGSSAHFIAPPSFGTGGWYRDETARLRAGAGLVHDDALGLAEFLES